MKFSLLSAMLMGLTGVAHAGIYPATPVGDTVWKVGSKVTIQWSDNKQLPPLSAIQPFEVALYTGTDQVQNKLAVVASNVAGSTTSLEYVVPNVSPYGKIYFLRFTAPNPSDPSEPFLFWTTRFTITNSDSTAPSPSGVGTGALASPTSAAQPASSSAANSTVAVPTTTQHSQATTLSSISSAISQVTSSVAPSVTPSSVGTAHSVASKPSGSLPTGEPQGSIAAAKSAATGLTTSSAYWTLLPIIGFLSMY
ncbi:hypothetical protein K7432_012857 [Basidiobolus ranarum]|uniref:Yeast cell wall synthesis Kre9/Knh1-like N-terminal domain-containing protein n=1 Tax=Basidiobolus ranarum TaxID=34480 RepID=A0ABR2VRM2_9FUNG